MKDIPNSAPPRYSYTCKECGGAMIGDGYKLVYHCENFYDIYDKEPDAGPIYCDNVLEKEAI